MKRYFILLIATMFSLALKAQEFANPNLASMVKTEREFSLTAKEKSTRTAFLAFTNDESLGFNNGPIPFRKHYEQQKEDSTWLWWEPDYVDIAASGDFGLSAGPWEIRKSRKAENVEAQGHFFTIWRKDQTGSWKVLIDLGIQYNQPLKRAKISTSAIPLKLPQKTSKEELLKIENGLIASQKAAITKAYNSVLSSEVRYYQNQFQPIIGKELVFDHLFKRESVTFTCIDGFLAKSGDLGVVYGTATIQKEEKAPPLKTNYVHVWKKENGKTWKLVIEVLK